MITLRPEFEHRDSRRTLTQLFTRDIKQVNFYKIKKGAVLGRHYHKYTTEYFYVISGTLRYNEEFNIATGDLFYIPIGITHSFRVLTRTLLMTFLDKPFSKEEPDLWKE